MNIYKQIEEAKDTLIERWGANGVTVINAAKREKKEMTFDEFLKDCTPCGGNWGGLLLSGIRKLFPRVYDAIPEQMAIDGNLAFALLIDTLILCGIRFPEEKEEK